MAEMESIFERIMKRDRREETGLVKDISVPAAQEGNETNEEEGKVMKARNYTALLVAGGVFTLAALSTAVLAQQDMLPFGDRLAGWIDRTPDETLEVAQADTKSSKPTAADKTIFDEHAEKAGVKNCKKLFPALGAAGAGGGTFKVVTRWDEKAPDDHSLISLFGMSLGGSQSASNGAGVVFATPVGKGCEGASVRVVPVNEDCQTFAKTLPQGSQLTDDLQGVALVTLPGDFQTMLVSSASSCVVVTVVGRAG